jgi:YidC/Oxa1 family membrane protein insertase
MPSFLGVFVDAAYHLVCALTGALTFLPGGLAAAAGIIIVTLAVRLLIAPLSFRALRGQAAQARLAPRLQALRQRYGKQPERFQREVTALYQREGTTPLAGIWPILAQWPFLSVMYVIFRSPRVAGGPNQLLTHTLLSVPLGAHWLAGPGVLSAQGGVFLGVMTVLAGLCWLSARVARQMTAAQAAPPASSSSPASPAPAAPKPAPPASSSKPPSSKPPSPKSSSPASMPSKPPSPSSLSAKPPSPRSAAPRRAAHATREAPEPVPALGGMKFITTVVPYVTVVIAAVLPLAAGLYLITTMAWSTAERWIFTRRSTQSPAVPTAPSLPAGTP